MSHKISYLGIIIIMRIQSIDLEEIVTEGDQLSGKVIGNKGNNDASLQLKTSNRTDQASLKLLQKVDHTSTIFHDKNYCKHLCKSTFALLHHLNLSNQESCQFCTSKLAYFRHKEHLLCQISVSANVDIIAFLKDPDVTRLTGVSVWVQSVLADSKAESQEEEV